MMFKCEYCDRELKSKAGLSRHMSACVSKPEMVPPLKDAKDVKCTAGAALVDIANEISDKVDAAMAKAKVVQLEVVGEGNYYVGHPRRLTKLKGMLSKTFDPSERQKIMRMIQDEDK